MLAYTLRMEYRALALIVLFACRGASGVESSKDVAPSAASPVVPSPPATVAPAASVPTPATPATATPPATPPAPLRLGVVLEPDEVLARANDYDGNEVRVRGKFVANGIEAGFPYITFVSMTSDPKTTEKSQIFACRGPFDPGNPGPKFARGTVIVARGRFDARRPDTKGRILPPLLELGECSIQKA